MSDDKTHYRKAFNSPYLSSADIVGPTVLTIKYVRLELDHSKKTKDSFNTAYFVETEIRKGEKLKPMILNVHNSKVLKGLSESHFIDDWNDIPITVYVDSNVRFGRDTVEGLRISPERPNTQRTSITKEHPIMWKNAIAAYKRDGDFEAVLKRADISKENMEEIRKECANNQQPGE